jgi:hypothetical protein
LNFLAITPERVKKSRYNLSLAAVHVTAAQGP